MSLNGLRAALADDPDYARIRAAAKRGIATDDER